MVIWKRAWRQSRAASLAESKMGHVFCTTVANFQHLGDHLLPTYCFLAWRPRGLIFFSARVIWAVLRCSFLSLLSLMALRILVLGSGGREHALAWKLAQSPLVGQIYVCPGNGGTSQVPKTTNVTVGSNTFPELVAFATQEKVL